MTRDAVMYSKRTGRVRCVLRDDLPDADLERHLRAHCPAGADVLVMESTSLHWHQAAATKATGKRPKDMHPEVYTVVNSVTPNAEVVEDRYCACAEDGTVLSAHHADPDCGDHPSHVGAHHFTLHATARVGEKI